MTWYPLQQRFSYGEIGRAFYSQQDSPIYEAGLAECFNAYPTPQGEVRTRAGLSYDYTVQTNYSGGGRVFSVDINADDRVIATMANKQLKIHTEAEFTRQGNFVPNYDFTGGSDGWIVADTTNAYAGIQTAAVPGSSLTGFAYVTAEDGNGAFDGSGYVRRIVPVIPAEGGTVLRYMVSGLEGYATGTPRIRVGTTGHGSFDLYDATHSVIAEENLEVSVALPGLDSYTGDVYIEFFEKADGADNPPRASILAYIGLFFDQPPLAELPPLVIPYENNELDEIQFIQNPYTNTSEHATRAMMVFVHPNHTPQELILDNVGDWIFRPIVFVPAGNKTDDPHWIDAPLPGDYPRAVGAHQGRCIYGGTESEPQSVWGSRPGNWYDVFQPETPDASTPIWYTMTAIGALQWILGYRELMHGTMNGENIISATGVLIQSSDIHVQEQSRFGSAHIQAELVGDECFYVAGDERKVRKITWHDEQQSWRSLDLTFTAQHITAGLVSRLAFSKDPQQVLWCPLDSGAFVGMSYEPGLDIHGWHQHETDGVVLDVTEARYGGVDHVIMLVRRHINDQDNLYLESMTRRQNLEAPHLDSYIWSQSADERTVVTGLEHLEGKEVTARTGGGEVGSYRVASGQITLANPVRDVVVGLPYTTRITTLPARPTPNLGGSQGSKKNWSRIGLRLNGSGRPIVNGVRYKPKPGAEDNGLVTGDFHQHHFGWDDWGQITIEQDNSDPLILTGIFGKLTDEEL